MSNNFIIDNMTWSFSRIQSFDQCPYAWKLKYLDEIKGIPNAYAQYGLFVHSILEKYFKNELSIFELSQYYSDYFNQYVTENFPRHPYVDLYESYYNKGKDYLDSFEGLDQYKILGTEGKIKLKIDNYNFTGYIDLLVENQNGELEIIDHKTRDLKPRSNRKKPTKSDGELDSYLRQLYLYAMYIHKKYNKYPKYLNFNIFRNNVWIKEEFKEGKLEEARQWLTNTIHNIEKEVEFKPKPDKFYCFNLCEFRRMCEPFRGVDGN